MDEQKIAAGLIFGAIAGLLVGLIPLIIGVKKRQTALGISGFFGSAISGTLFGLLLAVPIASIFTWLAVRAARTAAEPES